MLPLGDTRAEWVPRNRSYPPTAVRIATASTRTSAEAQSLRSPRPLGIACPSTRAIDTGSWIAASTRRIPEHFGHASAIAKQGSDRLRAIQSDSENYWYGFPPFPWILTPVITSVAVEYKPRAAEIAAAQAQKK